MENEKKLLEDPDLFFEMEKKYDLFSLRTDGDIPLWDIFRSEVWNFVIYKDDLKSKSAAPVGRIQNLITMIKRYLSLFKVFSKKKYFFFGVSRFVDSKKMYYDPYLESIKPIIGDNYTLYETVLNKSAYRDTGIFNISSSLQKILQPFYRKNALRELQSEHIEFVKNAIKETYGYEVVTSAVLENIFYKFKVHYLLYRQLFSIGKFKAVFLNQNGFQKGLIYAAKKIGIPVLEFQHADVIEFNVVWHYGTQPKTFQDIIFSDYFLTYSDFWSLQNNIPAECVEIGTAIHNINDHQVDATSVAIISTKEHEEELNSLVIKLAVNYPEVNYKYKLHPAQYDAIHEYIDLFSDYSNVEVVSVDKSISDLITEIQSFIVIYSSVIFELLQAKKDVYIYKRQNFWFFRKFFTVTDVYQFDSPEEFYNKYTAYSKSDHSRLLNFYKPLKLDRLQILLKNLKKIKD